MYYQIQLETKPTDLGDHNRFAYSKLVMFEKYLVHTGGFFT